MKKYKITEEQVKEEAGKFNMIINAEHFIAPEETKRGRPKSDKALAEQKKEKGAKGRPKKAQISLEIEGDDMISEEAAKVNFKELVRETIEEAESPKHNSGKKGKSDEEKEAERLAKEAEKKEKEAKRLAEKAEKEAKLAAEKEEKAAKKKAEEEARAAKKAAEEALAEQKKQAKKEEKEKAKAEKAAAKEAAKSAKKTGEKKAASVVTRSGSGADGASSVSDSSDLSAVVAAAMKDVQASLTR
jgi:hypothetical protein